MAAILGVIGAAAASSAVASPIGEMSGSFLGPWTRVLTHSENRRVGGLVPDWADLLDAWTRGYVEREDMNFASSLWGIFTGFGNDEGHRKRWHAIINSNKGFPPLESARIAWTRGLLGDDEFLATIKHNKLIDEWKQELVRQVPNPLPLSMLLTANLRGTIGDEDMRRQLRASGYAVESDLSAIENMRYQIPGPSDLIRFAVREAWDDEIAQRFGYDENFPERFNFWMEKQGLLYPVADIFPDAGPAGSVTWPQAYWRAHWTPMSPSQAFDAIHRLRPGRVSRYRSISPDVRPFTQSDLDTVLRIADYPPRVREWLAALSFRPLTRVDVRRMARVRVLNFSEVREAYQDLGYTEQDALRLAQFTRETNRQTESRLDKARARTEVRESYQLGLIDRDEASRLLFPLGNTSSRDLEQFGALPPTRQALFARSHSWVRIALGATEAAIVNDEAKDVRNQVKKGYLRGRISEMDASRALRAVGIRDDRITRYLKSWRLQRDVATRAPTAAQLVKWFKSGIIGLDESLESLENLGYSAKDAARIMRLVQTDVRGELAKLQEKQASNAKQRRSAQLAQLRAERSNRNRIIADLNRSATKAQILRFFTAGFLSREEAKAALANRGVTSADANRYIAEKERSGRNGRSTQT